ncbi:MAG: hypothetical protein PHY08_02920 [Candidatus Cloacimonetes bacterium]|jgi:hypothetical protein|nr:hypothetical protein [Candidatus Cloacimonadota bacterium]MDD4155504.1 hypothetical protein [Candidatus Cloacimonadota bacterium]
MIKSKDYTNSWLNIFSIINFFISFYISYFNISYSIASAFIRAATVLIIANVVGRILICLWKFAFPKNEWLLLVHGKPKVERRSKQPLDIEGFETG